jgi:N-acetylmuramoyl-L-alanine amidase
MTRDADVRVPLEQRTAIANDARGDLFVSIHANASTDAEIHGSETYFLALEASDSGAAGVAQRENSAFAAEAAREIDALSDPFIALLGDMISTEHLDESSAFAQRVQQELGAHAGAVARREAGDVRRALRRADARGAGRDRLRDPPRRRGRDERHRRAQGDRRRAREGGDRVRRALRCAPRPWARRRPRRTR